MAFSHVDGLLARYGYPERVESATALNSTFFTRIANTFLRRIWYYDYTPGSNLHNLLTDRIDGPNSGFYNPPNGNEPIPSLGITCDQAGSCKPLNGNAYSGGFVGLAQFNPWVWVRSRDSAFNTSVVPLPNGCINSPYAEASCTWPALGADAHAALLRYRAWW
jgi:hypothetical protein